MKKKSRIIILATVLFTVVIVGCKEEQEDLTTGIVGSYSGEFQWQDYMNNWEEKKENGILTIKKIDQTHVGISDNLGLFKFDFVEVYEKDANGAINFFQLIKSPLYGNLPFGYLVTGNRIENKIEFYFAYNQLYFTGVFVQ